MDDAIITTTANNAVDIFYEPLDEDGLEPNDIQAVRVIVQRVGGADSVQLTPTETGGVYSVSTLDIHDELGDGLYYTFFQMDTAEGTVDEVQLTVRIKAGAPEVTP